MKHVTDIIGPWGKWHWNIFLCCMSSAIFSAFNNMSSVFYAPTIKNITCADHYSFYVNETPPTDHCWVNSTTKCTKWNYDRSVFQSTAVDEVSARVMIIMTMT